MSDPKRTRHEIVAECKGYGKTVHLAMQSARKNARAFFESTNGEEVKFSFGHAHAETYTPAGDVFVWSIDVTATCPVISPPRTHEQIYNTAHGIPEDGWPEYKKERT